MSTGTYILVDQDQLNKISFQIEELKKLFISQTLNSRPGNPDEPMDSSDVLRYLKITRRTLYKYRRHGLPSIRNANGKLYFWRKDIDEFLKNQLPEQNRVVI